VFFSEHSELAENSSVHQVLSKRGRQLTELTVLILIVCVICYS